MITKNLKFIIEIEYMRILNRLFAERRNASPFGFGTCIWVVYAQCIDIKLELTILSAYTCARLHVFDMLYENRI